MKRRELLRSGITLFSLGFTAPPLLTRMALAQGNTTPDPGGDNILVMLLLDGGNDGLNTVVPYTDPVYYSSRPSLRLAGDKNDAQGRLPLISGALAFHPAMSRLKALYDAGQVAVVQNVGYPNPDYSHDRSMDIWQTAVPDRIEQQGWLGKYMDRAQATDRRPLYSLNIGRELPRAFVAERSFTPSVVDLSAYIYQTNARVPMNRGPQVAALQRINSHVPISKPYVGFIQKTAYEAYDTSERLQAAKNYKPSVSYPNDGLGQGMKLIAQVIMQNLGTKVFFVSIGGFDTHANQAYDHARLLGSVSNSIGAFYQDLKNQGREKKVLIVTFSEFGRRVRENGTASTAGTDHGAAAPMLVVGGKTRAGVYGENPFLGSADGNVHYTTDFRAVYATLLDRWLGASSPTMLGSPFQPIDFL
jgi:uncharacterized protein (DUF1501 family)